MAKKELFRNPFARFIITSMGAFPVERGKGDMAVIDIAVDRLNSGKNFMMFPEGARSKDGKVGKGKSGIAYIAAKSGKNVVPVGIIFEGKLKFRKKVIVRFGKPILAENFQLSDPPQKSELREIISVIMQEIENLVYQNENHVN
jgi:1-acyl-sn-glycerol-3-phosphate acyltransferase